jgi:polyferredoxin
MLFPSNQTHKEIDIMRSKQLRTRQRIRKTLQFTSFLLLPATLYYFSPALILQGASEGIVNGSLIVFAALFVSSLLVGRFWCGWLCPTGGLQETCQPLNNQPTSAKINWTKWAIWIPWLGLIAFLAIRAGGYHEINPFYQIETGVTMALPLDGDGPPWFLIYYIIIALFFGLALFVGRRAACHTICWMAPFMIVGRWIRNHVRWPSLRLKAEPSKCIDCKACTRACPMSLDVHWLVRSGAVEHSECVLCGACVDTCPKDVIDFTFSSSPPFTQSGG